jgi:hypothetical protein
MLSDDTVMVQPVRTFLEGRDLKHPESEPYLVSRPRMVELRGNGLVEHIESQAVTAAPDVPPPEATAAAEAPEVPAETVAPRRRGRPPKTR